jgi:flagellar basal body-associated protein FliL
MIALKILLIVLIVFAVLFILSLLIYFFNLDMKVATAVMPVLEKFYDRQEKKREK